MKEYSITLTFAVEAKKADYDDVNEFAEKFIDKILANDDLTCFDNIEIVDATLDEVVDYSGYDEDDEDILEEE